MPISKIKAGGISDDAVTTAKIVDGTVAAVDIADGAVASAKLDTNIDIAGTLDVTSTLTADGNVFVGHTSQYSPIQNGGSGVTLNTNGQVFAGGQFPSYFNREDSDGDVLVFRKDGIILGSIGNTNGSAPGDLYICSSTASHCGISFSGNRYVPTDNTGSYLDNAVDVGESSTRFKDLYLSGGVYLGGTDSANYLDDYEEGTSEVSVNGITASTNIVNMNYVKVGSLVHIIGEVVISGKSANSGNANFALPFTPSGTHSFSSTVGGTIHYNTIASSIDYFGLYGGNASVYGNDATGSFTNNYIHSSNWTDGRIGFTLTYTTF